ncbi:MAG: hypothetical protein QM640_13145 [Niabella sp.]
MIFAQYKTRQEKGYFNITNIAEPQYLQSIDTSNLSNATTYIKRVGFSFNTINGIFLNPNFSAGLGAGMQFTQYKAYMAAGADQSRSLTLLPVFADFRYYPADHRNDAMFILDVGYAPLLKIGEADDKAYLGGGALLKLGAGYKFELGDIMSLLPSVSFNAQRLGANTVLGVSIGVGLMF